MSWYLTKYPQRMHQSRAICSNFHTNVYFVLRVGCIMTVKQDHLTATTIIVVLANHLVTTIV